MLKDVESQLSTLPPNPSDDAQGEVILLVSDFARELATYVEGTPDDNGIHQLIRPLNNEFLAEIWSTAQPFSPYKDEWVPKGRRVSFTHPQLVTSCTEQDIYSNDDGTIHVNEVMEMANG